MFQAHEKEQALPCRLSRLVGGPVAFGGSKGQITGKGKIKTRKLDFEDVYFVKELQHFNLFSVSQMCDKKNKVLKRFSWVFFLRTKDETSSILKDFLRQIENQFNQKAEAVNTACYVLSRVLVTKPQNKTPYELLTAETLRKKFAQITNDLLLQGGTARASSTNYIPSLEDIYKVSKDGIFTSASYDVEGAVADFTNLETTINALKDESLVDAMQEDLLQFKIQKVCILVDLPFGKKEIGTKWVYRNKNDKRGVVVRNKARLVAQGHRQEEGIDYDKEVYVSQPPGFIDPKFQNKVYKVVKALYGLHQAPRAWYATLSTFLVQSGYRRGLIDKTLFIKKDKKDIMLVKQREYGIFISHDKYVAEILTNFYFISVKTASTSIETNKPLVKDEEAADVDVTLKTLHLQAVKRIFRYLKGQLKLGPWYPRELAFDLEAYSDSDYARANLDRKSTTEGCQFLGRRLISWQCKKQTIIATSTTEAEYVAAASCCGQVLWIQNQMHHFIRDAYEKKLIQVLKIHTDDNVADILTKAFDVSRFIS
uniref:Reverse transcriptase Ty1/copia-type domain-containing protein n=1 Tax=Tanacetum cinerariifolium TaxID=118510 RepID=A0A699I8V3_TANCI|nr:hypothetical protein [Tanacetum cinerariifolium]